MNNTDKNKKKEFVNQDNIKNNIELKSDVNIDCGDKSIEELKKRYEAVKKLYVRKVK